MTRDPNKLVAVLAAGALAVALAACGGSGDSNGGNAAAASGAGEPWILGTTDTVTALDPAGSYDLGSSTLEYNLYQTLVTVPPNSTKIVGDAAKSCAYDDPKTLTCTLNPGVKFSNGDALTSSDVKYSFERAIKIQDANGAAIYLLGSITDTAKDGTVTLNKGAIETPDDTDGRLPPRPPRHHVPVRPDLPGRGGDRRRGRLPGRQEAGRRQGHRLRPLQAEPVQGRRAGRARAQPELHRARTRARRRRSSSSTTPSRRR